MQGCLNTLCYLLLPSCCPFCVAGLWACCETVTWVEKTSGLFEWNHTCDETWSPLPAPVSLRRLCYSVLGIPEFWVSLSFGYPRVLGIPVPKTVVFWISPLEKRKTPENWIKCENADSNMAPLYYLSWAKNNCLQTSENCHPKLTLAL